MVTADIAQTAVGIIGNIIASCLFLSPVPTFVQICKKGSVEQYSAVPYLATLMNCMVWTLYGLPMVHPHSLLVVTINGAGCVIEIIYVTLFFIYSDRTKRLKVFLWLFLELIFITILTLLTFTLIPTTKNRSAVVGTICLLFNIAMYASPLSVMKLVITTKSVEYMPFFLSLASFGNGVSWTTYAFIPFDPFIALLVAGGGMYIEVFNRGVIPLAYSIRTKNKAGETNNYFDGIYLLFTYFTKPESISILEETLKADDNIIRSMTSKIRKRKY